MKIAIRVMAGIALIYFIYAFWAQKQWDSVGNQTGVIETCRWKITDGIKKSDCLIKLSDGVRGSLKQFILDDESHKQVTVKVEVNRLRKKRKRYTFISSN